MEYWERTPHTADTADTAWTTLPVAHVALHEFHLMLHYPIPTDTADYTTYRAKCLYIHTVKTVIRQAKEIPDKSSHHQWELPTHSLIQLLTYNWPNSTLKITISHCYQENIRVSEFSNWLQCIFITHSLTKTTMLIKKLNFYPVISANNNNHAPPPPHAPQAI